MSRNLLGLLPAFAWQNDVLAFRQDDPREVSSPSDAPARYWPAQGRANPMGLLYDCTAYIHPPKFNISHNTAAGYLLPA